MSSSAGNRGILRTSPRDRKIVEQRVFEEPDAGYPSLREHMATRRFFLEVMGASLATAGGLLLGCHVGPGADDDAGTGGPEASTQQPDASGPPDATVRPPGGEQWPGYHTIRIPLQDSLTVYMLDHYGVIFHVDAATYDADTYLTLLEHPLAAQDLCRDLVSEQSYEALNSPRGLATVEDRLLAALDGLVMTLDSHDQPTIELVALHISKFEDPVILPGDMRKPSYP